MDPGPAKPHGIQHAEEEQRCPECDAAADWQVSRRHRFSPFGSVLLAVLAFWSAVFGWLLSLGYLPSLALLVAAFIIGVATRQAQICGSCGFVRRHRG
jgi:hypothetical protein